MFMIYIRYNGKYVKQEIREARTLEAYRHRYGDYDSFGLS